MNTDNRPLSPHLQVYRPQLTSVLSIIHRASGVFLGVGAVLMVIWLLAAASGPDAFAKVNARLSGISGQLLLGACTAAFYYHSINGIRHLLWDAGWLLELKGAYASGWLVVALTLLFTALTWGVLA